MQVTEQLVLILDASDDVMLRILGEPRYSFTTSAGREIIQDIQEKSAFVAKPKMTKCEKSSDFENNYELSNEQATAICNERFRYLEFVFEPSLIGKESSVSVHRYFYNKLYK